MDRDAVRVDGIMSYDKRCSTLANMEESVCLSRRPGIVGYVSLDTSIPHRFSELTILMRYESQLPGSCFKHQLSGLLSFFTCSLSHRETDQL
jgi:hypothetical protein